MPALREGAWSRRSSVSVGDYVRAFKPTDVPNIELWLDARNITGLSDGAAVATWPDASGKARDHTQATGSLQPLWKASAINGGPAVLFDGVDDYMSKIASGYNLSTMPWTVFVVAQNVGGLSSELRAMASWTNVAAFTLQWNTGGYWEMELSGLGNNQGTSVFDSNVHVWSCSPDLVVDSLRSNGRYNGLSAGAMSQPGAGGNNWFVGSRAGSGRFWKGYVKHVVLYSRRLTPWEHYNVARYLAADAGLTVTPHVPTDVTGIKFWTAADDLALTDGASALQLTDKSGLGNDLTQATAALRATWWSKACRGLPAFRFNGTSQFYERSVSTGFAGLRAMSAAAIVSPPQPSTQWNGADGNPPNKGPVISVGTPSFPGSTFNAFWGISNTMRCGVQIHSGANLNSVRDLHAAPWSADDVMVWLARSDWLAQTGQFYRDGVAAGDKVYADQPPAIQSGTLKIRVGQGDPNTAPLNYYPGDLVEVVLGGSSWSDLERLIIEDYLRRRILV